MIEELSIRNLVLVEEARVSFGPGLNILTGETGSGKSAVLAAIRLVLGDRADGTLIRKGAEMAVVEASVRVKGRIEDVEVSGGAVSIRRELHRSGKSRCFVEDQQVSLAQLRSWLASSIELVDQSASQKLSDGEVQRRFVDAFGGLEGVREAEEAARGRLREAEAALEEMGRLKEASGREGERMRDDLSFLEQVDWQRGEEEALVRELGVLTHAQELVEKLSGVVEFLSEGSAPVLPMLKRFAYQLEQLQRIDPKLQECGEGIRSGCASFEEVGHFLTSYVDRLEVNPRRVEAIERRIAEIESVKRRFGKSQEELEVLRIELGGKLGKIDLLDEEIEAAKKNVEEALARFHSAAKRLLEGRRRTAPLLAQAVMEELKRMNLASAQFVIEVEAGVKWLFCANPGQVPLTLDRCASGGELSRLLLAVKIAMAGKEGSSCLIFDEIDSNVGGKTAALLGQQLQDLSRSCQLICVTHFVQVARYALHHFLVRKEMGGEEAITRVVKLREEERLEEYARMTGID